MGPSPWQLLIVLVIVLLLFGAKRLSGLGSGLGSAIRNFRSAMKEEETKPESTTTKTIRQDKDAELIEGELQSKQDKKSNV